MKENSARTQTAVAKAFGERLAQLRREKAARERHDILQKDIAEALGVAPASVTRWESGLAMPKDDMMIRIAQYFDVGEGWLRYGDRNDGSAPRLPLREPQRPILPRQRKRNG